MSLHILIVEDQAPMAIVLQRLVEPLQSHFVGSRLTITSSLSECLDIVAQFPAPDIVILDLTLADSSMEETITKLDQIEDRSPLVIVTGYSREMIVKLLGENHAHLEIIQKDITLGRNLLGAIAKAIAEWKNKRFRKIDENLVRMKEIIESNAPAEKPGL